MYVDIVICKAILFLLLKHLFWRQIDSSLNEFDQVWARIFLKLVYKEQSVRTLHILPTVPLYTIEGLC